MGVFITEAGSSKTDDQIASEVPFTPAGDIAATDVQAAIEEVDTEKMKRIVSVDNEIARFDSIGGNVQGYSSNAPTIDDDGLAAFPGGLKVFVSNKTDTYNITLADFGKSLRMNSANDKTFNLPSVGASEDGARVTIEKLAAGKVTIDAADSDKIADSGAGQTIYNDIAAEIYANITLEYIHSVVTWVIIGGHGTWVTTV